MKDLKNTNRRDFLKKGAATVAGAICFSGGLKDALAFAKSIGKPILTQETLNQLFQRSYESKQIRSLAKQIKNDPIGWLKKEFALTKEQIKTIESIPSYHWNEVKKVLNAVEKNGSYLTVQIERTSDKTPLFIEMSEEYFGTCKATVKAKADRGGNASVEASLSYEFSI